VRCNLTLRSAPVLQDIREEKEWWIVGDEAIKWEFAWQDRSKTVTKESPWIINASDYPQQASWSDRCRFLARYAVLAPSSHNTQPWKFRISENTMDVFMDESRWLKVADDDQRELHISIGCAIENLLIAAEHFGLAHQVAYLPDPSNPMHAAKVEFTANKVASSVRPDSLFSMIVVRHTHHGEYESRPIPAEVLASLQSLCNESGIALYLTSDEQIKRKVDALVVQADALEFADPEFRRELGYWIGQGVFGTSWLMSKLGKLAVTYVNMGSSTAKKDSTVLMSSPVLGLISTAKNDRISQVKAGQVYQRLSLLAASHGIWCQPMSQIIQVEDVKAEVVSLQPDSRLFPQHPFRIGYAPAEKQHTPRQEMAAVIL
jgi:hypothetical protein